MMSASNEPLFLQFKEAVESVLEPYAGKSAYAQHGQRVVMGQRLMQPASDLFLGWVIAPTGKHFYVRQLRDAKIKPLVETFDDEMLVLYAKACGWVLARAHAKASDVSADRWLSRLERSVRRGDGRLCAGLCGPGGAGLCCTQGRCAKGQDQRLSGNLTAQALLPIDLDQSIRSPLRLIVATTLVDCL